LMIYAPLLLIAENISLFYLNIWTGKILPSVWGTKEKYYLVSEVSEGAGVAARRIFAAAIISLNAFSCSACG